MTSQNQTFTIDINSIFNYMFILVVVVMMFRMVDRVLEPERPKMLYPGKIPPGYKPVRHSSTRSEIVKRYHGAYLANWQYGGYSYIEEDPGKPPELWSKGWVDYANPEDVIAIAEREGLLGIHLAGGFWEEIGYKGYGERVSISEAKIALAKAREYVFGSSRSPEHHSMWLTPEQRKELEKKYGAVAVRWAEEATRPSDIKGVEVAAEYYHGKLREVLGLGHLSPELTEEQLRKLRELLGLTPDVAEVLKIHRETGYIP